MSDSESEEIAVIGNTDITSAELENNIRNTVEFSPEFLSLLNFVDCFELP